MRGSQLFETEKFFAQNEFTARHLLAASDCESVSVHDLLELSGGSLEELGRVWLGYTEPQGSPELRASDRRNL